MRFGVAVKGHAISRKPLQVHDGGDHAFAAEAIKGPEQNNVEPSLCRVIEQPNEGLPLSLASALMIDILANDLVPLTPFPLAALAGSQGLGPYQRC